MGLLLSILIFSVGVLEVVACVRHIQYGYLPDWAPRRHVLATSTSGFTKLRDRWRKKPSKSVDYYNKTKKSDYDVSRSCDVPYYGDECHEPLKDRELSDKCDSLLEQREDTSANDFISTDVGEFNLRYQEFEEILPRESNTLNKYENSAIHLHNVVSDQPFRDVPAQITENSITKTKRHPPCIEHIAAEESVNLYGQISRSQSSSPRKSKTDISWPLFTLHIPVSRRPSTPTTAEEDGGQSPYFCGELLTEEHIKSTQRPLAVHSETYHTDQDITPVLYTAAEDCTRSVTRPLNITAHFDEQGTERDVCNDSITNQKEDNCILEIIEVTSSAVNESTPHVISDSPDEDPSIQTNSGSGVDAISLSPNANRVKVDDVMMSTSEEDKVTEAYIKQKRRTSKTGYLPSHEEVMKIPLPESTFAAQKEEPLRLKPAKATSFEEARLERFNADTFYADMSVTLHDGESQPRILCDVGLNVTELSSVDDSSSVIGEIQLIPAEDLPQVCKNSMTDITGSWVDQISAKNESSSQVEIEVEESDRRKILQFDHDLHAADLEVSGQLLNIKISPESIKPHAVIFEDVCNLQPIVNLTAVRAVDKIIDEAVAVVSKKLSEHSSDCTNQRADQSCATELLSHDYNKEEIIARNEPLTNKKEEHSSTYGHVSENQVKLEPVPILAYPSLHPDRNINVTASTANKIVPSTRESIDTCTDEPEETVLNKTEVTMWHQPRRCNVTEIPSVENQHSKNDSKETKSFEKSTCEMVNSMEDPQEVFKPSVSVSHKVDETILPRGEKFTYCEENSGDEDKRTDRLELVNSSNLPEDLSSDTSIAEDTNTTKINEIEESCLKTHSQEILLTTQDKPYREKSREKDLVLDHTQASEENSKLSIKTKFDSLPVSEETTISCNNSNTAQRSELRNERKSSEVKDASDELQQRQQTSESAPEAFWVSGRHGSLSASLSSK